MTVRDAIAATELLQKWHSNQKMKGRRGVDATWVLAISLIGGFVLLLIGVVGLVIRFGPAATATTPKTALPPRPAFLTDVQLKAGYAADERRVVQLAGTFAKRANRYQIFADLMADPTGIRSPSLPYHPHRIKLADLSDAARGVRFQVPLVFRHNSPIGHAPNEPWMFKWGEAIDAQQVIPFTYGRLVIIGDASDDEQHIYFVITPDFINSQRYLAVLTASELEFSHTWQQQEAPKSSTPAQGG